MTTETVDTEAGTARITWHPAERPHAVLAVEPWRGRRHRGAGSAGPRRRAPGARRDRRPGGAALAGGREEGRARAEDAGRGWRGLWPALAGPGLPVIAGGRSAGARVACRTAAELGAARRTRAELPAAPAGQAGEVPGRRTARGRGAHARRPGRRTIRSGSRRSSRTGSYELVEVPYGDHGFAVPKRAPLTAGGGAERCSRTVSWSGSRHSDDGPGGGSGNAERRASVVRIRQCERPR